MRVLIITNFYPSSELPGKGAAVRVQEMGLRKLGVELRVMEIPRAQRGRLAYCRLPFELLKAVRTFHPQIVHVHYGGVQAAIVAYLLRGRCIVTFHGTDLHGVYGGTHPALIGRLTHRMGVSCSRFAARRSGWNVLVSRTLLSALDSVTGSRVSIISTGVDLDLFIPLPRDEAIRRLGLNPSYKYVLFSDANSAPVKRRDLADKALGEAQRLVPEARMLTLRGQPFEHVPLYINASHCLLLTSEMEGSPNIVKECLACNIPIVSVDVGDVREMLTGVIPSAIVPSDPFLLGKGLVQVLRMNERSNGREVARKRIDNELICQNVMQVYQKVLSNLRS